MGQDSLTIEELLEIAESPDQRSHSSEKKTDVNKYIKYFNIQAGSDRVLAKIIYYHYRKWRKQNYMSKDAFFKHFSHIYDKCEATTEVTYYLNGEPFDLSLEGRLKSRAFLRKERDAKRKKAKEGKPKGS